VWAPLALPSTRQKWSHTRGGISSGEQFNIVSMYLLPSQDGTQPLLISEDPAPVGLLELT